MALFRTEKPKQFTYVPRFYDQRKEELDNRIDDIRKELEGKEEGRYVPNIKGRMRSRHEALWGKDPKSRNLALTRRLITVITVAMVLVIGYFILRILAVVDKM